MTANNAAEKLGKANGNRRLGQQTGRESALQRTPILTHQRSRQQRFSATNRLMISILHDLRNPLSTIFGCAEMLEGANLDPIQTKRVNTNIQRAAGRLRDLVGALASSMQGEREAIQPCNLHAIVVAACEAAGVADHSGIRMFLNVPARLEIALARTRVERVILNLVANAMEAMPDHGEIRINAIERGNCIRISVEDTGPGIPPGIRNRLFEPFVTAGKKEGLGLGLSFCRETIRDHGGELWLEAAAGARFVMLLPHR